MDAPVPESIGRDLLMDLTIFNFIILILYDAQLKDSDHAIPSVLVQDQYIWVDFNLFDSWVLNRATPPCS